MRLQLIVPKVEPSKIEEPSRCRYRGCRRRRFDLWQNVRKPVRDTEIQTATARAVAA
jgi:hypothetical protein